MDTSGDSPEAFLGSQGERRSARWLPWVALPYAVAVVCLLLRQPDVVGLLHDDGVYYSMARSIERGAGPVDGHMVESARTNRFPALFPALLATAAEPLRVARDGLGGVHRLVALNGVWLGIALFAFLQWLLRFKRWPPLLAACCAALLFTLPHVIGLAQHLMSESLFLAEVTVALLLCERAAARGTRGSLLLAGLASGLLPATRTAGAAIAAGLALFQVARVERGRRVALFAAGAAAPWIAFAVWSFSSRGSAIVDSPLLGPPYLRLFLAHLRELPWIAWVNLVRCADGWLSIVAPGAPAAASAASALARAGIALICLGAVVAAAVRGRRGIELFACVPYLALLLIWPFPDLRFVVPVAGLLFVAMVDASRTLVRAATPAWGIAAVALLIWNARLATRALDCGLHEAPFFSSRVPVAPLREAASWLQAATPRTALFASSLDPALHFLSDRPGVSPWANDLAYLESYFDRRPSWRRLYGGAPSRAAMEALFAHADDVLAQYRRLGVRHVVHLRTGPIGHATYEALVDHLVRTHPPTSHLFERVFTTSDRSIEIWRFDAAAR